MTELPELTLAEPGMVALVSVCAVVAGFVRGFTGFGGPALMALVLIQVYAPVSVITKLLLIDFVSYSILLPSAAREFDRRVVLTGLASSAMGVPVGLWILGTLDPELTKRAIAAVIAIGTVFVIGGWRFRRMPGTAVQLAIGFVGGVVIGTTYIALIMMVFIFSLPLSAATSRANAIYWGVTVAAAMVGAHVWLGNIELEDIWRCAVVGIIYLAAAFVGSKAFRRVGESSFRRLVAWLLLVLAVAGVVF